MAKKVALRAVKDVKGGGHQGAMTGAIVATSIVFFPAAPLFLLMHGKDITIPKGTEITAYVNGDTPLEPKRFATKEETIAAPSQPVASEVHSVSPEAALSSVEISSTPDAAEITVDDKYRGSTPATLKLGAGDHHVRLEKSGFKSWEKTLTLDAGENTKINAKRAATTELDDKGKPVPSEKQVVVFPGLEVTLSAPPCQVLLILDANFPENLLDSVLNALTIVPVDKASSKAHATVTPVSGTHVHDLAHLYQVLSNHTYLLERFTVIPNVSENGYKSLLRKGFADYYKGMPCVGGYLDGPVANLGKGIQAIISGEDRNYGFKPIAVFQTSDNRERNQQQLHTIPRLEVRIREVKKLLLGNRNALATLTDADNQYQELRARWSKLHQDKLSILEKQCAEFNQLSKGLIRVALKGSLDVDSLKHSLKEAFAGLNIRETKIEDLCGRVSESGDLLKTWSHVVTELESVAMYQAKSADLPPPTPFLDEIKLTD